MNAAFRQFPFGISIPRHIKKWRGALVGICLANNLGHDKDARIKRANGLMEGRFLPEGTP